MRFWLIIIPIALAVALAGCGGGGGGGATLAGRVIDGGTSTPLAGVRVALGTSNTLTAADGTFTLTGLAQGAGLVTAQLTGYEISSVPVTIVAGLNTLPNDVLMAQASGNPPGDSPRTIEGTIALSDGSNPSGAVVTLLSGATQVDQATVGSDGRYFFWAPAGSYTVHAEKTAFIAAEQQVNVTDLTKIVTANLTLQKS